MMTNSTVSPPAETPPESERPSLPSLALLFLRLGLTAFGGPAAHIAMMQQEIVERRRWLSKQEFLDLLGASNLIPGPSSTELAIHIGYRLAKWTGLLLAGVCFILPAFLLVIGIAWAYVRYAHLPQAAALLYGMKPVVVAIIAQALWNLGGSALKTSLLVIVSVAAAAAALFGISPLFILLGAGLLVAGKPWFTSAEKRAVLPLLALVSLVAVFTVIPILAGRLITTSSPDSRSLFLVFLKFGSIVYGSGYVLLAFLRTDLISRLHWMTPAQLLDATAVGQITPGPVFTTATFIGFILGGPAGAVAATAGIFLPAFVFVVISGPLVPGLRKSPIAGAFLDGVNAASLALMAVVTWELGRAALVDLVTISTAAAAGILLVRFRINSLWLILGGACIGLLSIVIKAHG